MLLITGTRDMGKGDLYNISLLFRQRTVKKYAEILKMIAASGCTPFLNVFKTLGESQGIISFPFKGYTLR
jgi:hypothetical protein